MVRTLGGAESAHILTPNPHTARSTPRHTARAARDPSRAALALSPVLPRNRVPTLRLSRTYTREAADVDSAFCAPRHTQSAPPGAL